MDSFTHYDHLPSLMESHLMNNGSFLLVVPTIEFRKYSCGEDDIKFLRFSCRVVSGNRLLSMSNSSVSVVNP